MYPYIPPFSPLPLPLPQRSSVFPPIGSERPGGGGIYAGIMRGRNGAPDYRLIVGPQFDGETKWQAAMEWACRLQVGDHKDFALPYRAEQSLMFANVPGLFNKKSWYWSCEQHAEDDECAWMQDFDYGTQGYGHKDNDGRVRAVRRVAI